MVKVVLDMAVRVQVELVVCMVLHRVVLVVVLEGYW
jgi:hypothetical protein